MRSGTYSACKTPASSTQGGVRRWGCFCKSQAILSRIVAHKLSRYPLAYSIVVIPLSVSRWLLFSHKSVPSAATFFGIIMFNLSGAINVLLFLIVRPHLLLFTPPEEPIEELDDPI